MSQKAQVLIQMPPVLEKVQPTFGSSFLLQRFYKDNPNTRPSWHYHPELELVYIAKGSGKIHIGRHLSYYTDGVLLLIGPNLPHLGFVDRMTLNEEEIIAQFRVDFLGEDFFSSPEMYKIQQLIVRSASGIRFDDTLLPYFGNKLKELLEMNQFNKLIYFLKMLEEMSEINEYELLNAESHFLISNQQDNDRMDQIFKFVRNNFDGEISLDQIANEVSLTVPAFCRYFKKSTSKTFTEYVNEFRIVHATKLLAEGQLSLTEVFMECGFNSQSHFIKQFKKITGQTPSQYRNGLIKTIS